MNRHFAWLEPGSIAARLLRRLLLGGAALGLLLAGVMAWLVQDQTEELLDYQLEQVARVLIDHDFSRLNVPLVQDPAAHLSVQVLDADGHALYRSEDLRLREDTLLGFTRQIGQTGEDADEDTELRVFTLRSEQRTVQVVQPWSLRHELVFDAAVQLLAPVGVLIVAMALLSVAVVRSGLEPLVRLRGELQRRDASALIPLDTTREPAELREPLDAINGLMARLEASLSAHRRFIADAAHQLRTPLAVVRLQSDRLAQARGEAERAQAQVALDAGVDRLTRLVEQLLALARLENAAAPVHATVDLAALAGQCLVDVAAVAAQRGVELSLEAEGPVRVRGDADGLRMLADNLVDNAIKHTPAGGAVQVRVGGAADGAALWVLDQGPGIAQADRERVLQRFARGAAAGTVGSGLGLAIAAEVARQHGAHLVLNDGPGGRGLCAGVQGLERAPDV